MTCIPDHSAFLWKGIKRMAGNVPGGLDIIFRKQLEQSAHAHSTGE